MTDQHAHYDTDDYDFVVDLEDPNQPSGGVEYRCHECDDPVPAGARWCDPCASTPPPPAPGVDVCTMCETEPPTEHYGAPVCEACRDMLGAIDAALAELEAVDPALREIGERINVLGNEMVQATADAMKIARDLSLETF